MERLITAFGIERGDCVSLIGSGGKTTLLYHLAKTALVDTVLISTTTKIGLPAENAYDYFVEEADLPYTKPRLGRTLTAGRRDTGKLCAVDKKQLHAATKKYSLTLLESDGSRNLPLKGWAPYEPVVPTFTTVTVGIIPIWPIGKPAGEHLIHRFPLFSSLTGILPEQIITPSHLVKAITGTQEKGLFSTAVGRKVLFFSQVETSEAFSTAQKLASLLPKSFTNELHTIVAGSAKNGTGKSLVLP